MEPLEPGEIEIQWDVNEAERPEDLWRLVHPNHMDGEFPGRGALNDKQSQASVVRSSLRTAEQAFDHHVKTRACAGAWPLGLDVVLEVECRAVDDSATSQPTPPGHAYIDFRHLSPEDWKGVARVALLAEMKIRGRAHPDGSP